MSISPCTKKINILLVDDRPENLISLAAVLDHPDYHLVKAGSGQEALRALLQDSFALILIDVQMPGMDGFETVELIKQRNKSQRIPVIFVTAIRQDEPFIYKGYSVGAVDYIFKPFDPDILRSKVAVFADLHRKTLQVQEQSEQLREAERLAQERRLAELELESLRREQRVQRQYRDLVERIPNGVVWAMEPGSHVFGFMSSKAEQVFGLPADAWMERSQQWLERVPEEDLARLLELLSGSEDDGDRAIEHRFVRADGKVIWLHTGVRVVEKDHGGGLELRGLSVEVTHIKEAEETAREALRARDEFLSIASHELRTPLTPLMLHVQSLHRWLASPQATSEKACEYMRNRLEPFDRQLRRLNKLVDELLDVTRINNGQLKLELEPVNLGNVASDVASRFAEDLRKIGSEVTLEVEEGIVGRWDPLRVDQVVTNMVTNALKYGEGKPVRIRAWREGGSAFISVEDQGMGIRKEDQERIFQRFERVGRIQNTSISGLGLGLYIVTEILKAHQGSIRVKSEEGKGATFTVELPLEAGTPGLIIAKDDGVRASSQS